MKGLFLLVLVSHSAKLITGQDCDPAVSIEKTHSWSSGYIGKLTVDQTWLSQQTEDWSLNITFCNNVTEFKVNILYFILIHSPQRRSRKTILFHL